MEPIQLKNLLKATLNELLKPITERLDRIEAALSNKGTAKPTTKDKK